MTVTQLKPPKTVPDHPPAATAGVVLEQRGAKENELASLEALIAETAYAATVSGKTGALKDLHDKIQSARFAVDCNAAAHSYALEADKAAIAAWWTQVHAMPPEEAIAGITKTECCRRCSEHSGCVLSGGLECLHPLKMGPNLNSRHQGNPAVRRLHKAAAIKLGVYR
jgi:hypothetical protein